MYFHYTLVDMDRFTRTKMDRMEEEQEKADLRKLEEFKAKYKRPKRKPSPEVENVTETMAKRRKVDLAFGLASWRAEPSPWGPEEVRDDQDLDLGLWLRIGEERCTRAGNLRNRLAEDNLRVLRKMSEWNKKYPFKESRLVECVNFKTTERVEPNPDQDDRLATDDSLEDGLGARHPINQPNTRSCLEGERSSTGVTSVSGRAVPSQEPVVETFTSLKYVVSAGARHPRKKPNTRSCMEGDDLSTIKNRRAVPKPNQKPKPIVQTMY
jgi:hypothetical protein